MASGTIDGKYYDNIPTPEDWGKAQAELANTESLLAQTTEAMEEFAAERDAAIERAEAAEALADDVFEAAVKIRTEVMVFLHYLDNGVFDYKIKDRPPLLHAEDLMVGLETLRRLCPPFAPAEAQTRKAEGN